MMYLRVSLLAASLLGVVACSTTNLEEPAELVDFKQQAEIDQVWDFSLSDKGEEQLLGLRPVSDGQRVYAADHAGRVVALDAATGKLAWSVDTDEEFWADGLPFSAGPSVGEGRVIVGSLNGDVLALDAVTGEELWQINVDAELVSAPLIDSGRVLVRTNDGRLLTFDAVTGNESWSTVRDLPLLTLRGQSQPAVEDGKAYVAWDSGHVSAINLATGTPLWEVAIGQPSGKTELEQINDIDGDVVVFGAEIYVAGHNTNLAALAIESGEVLWREELSAVRGPAVSYGSVVVTDIDSVIRAYDRLTGNSLWTQDVIRARGVSGPALWKDFIAVGDFEGYVHLFDRISGKMLARFSHDGEPVTATPIVVGELLVVQSTDGELAAYRQLGETTE